MQTEPAIDDVPAIDLQHASLRLLKEPHAHGNGYYRMIVIGPDHDKPFSGQRPRGI